MNDLDWNFDAVPDPELVACCYWEYARESAFIRELLAGHRDEFEDIAKFIVREDPAISPGGCLVETEWGTIDARIEKRLAVIKQLWREAARTPVVEPEENDS